MKREGVLATRSVLPLGVIILLALVAKPVHGAEDGSTRVGAVAASGDGPVLAAESEDGLMVVADSATASDPPGDPKGPKHKRRRRKIASPTGLWEDRATGQLFTKPGKGRVPYRGVRLERSLEKQVEKKVERKDAQLIHTEIQKSQEETRAVNAAMAHEIQQMQPAWQEYGEKFFKKFKIGTLFYADYSFYSHTGFGPQFLTQINPPGPGNNAFNSFDVTRTYINLYFSPTDDWTFRLTPNIYRTQGAAASGTKFGKESSVGSNLDGNLGFRLKYAYLDYNKAFRWSDALHDDKITIGQIPNPLVAWEEDLYGFRYVNLVPWNFLSLSSTQTGGSVHGPVMFHERQYLDYDFGVYTNSSFRAFEQTNTKQAMVRGSLYPFGARSRFDGLGITGFYDYGYANTTPDNTNLVGPSSGQRQGHLDRVAALLHYTAETWQLAGEYDDAHNAFTTGNLFSAQGPLDEFGPGGTGPGGSATSTCVSTAGAPIPGCFSAVDGLAKALLNNGGAHEMGWAIFGHLDIPRTAFTLFGMFEEFFPNTKVDRNPFDFQRFVVGVQYKWSKNLRFAFDSQNILYYHSQFSFPKGEANAFGSNIVSPRSSPAPGPVGTTATPFPVDIPFAVQRDIHAFFLNVEFSY